MITMSYQLSNPPRVSVIFSFRNEERVFPELIRRVRETLDQEQNNKKILNYELIFINDASTDSSLEVLLDQAKGHRDIRILNMSRRFGVSPCVMAGLQHASGDVVIYMDADLQDPPELIPTLLETWRGKEADVVHTVRQSRKGEPTIKLLITKVGYIILNKFTSIKLPIEAGDFKLLSRRAVEHLIELKENQPFMRGLVCWIGFKQEFVSYHRERRYDGKTKFPVFSFDVIGNFFNSALISFSSAPLRISIIFGTLAIFFDFIFIGHVLTEKISGRAIPGWTAIMIAVLFFGGVQLFCLGIIGLYLNSIHEQSKQRPNYIIESTYGFSIEDVKPVFVKNKDTINFTQLR